MKKSTVPAILFICGASSACGAEAPIQDDATATEREAVVVEQLVLNTFEVHDETITFFAVESPDGPVVQMQEIGSAKRPLLGDILLQEHGYLTLLERFHAVAPKGTLPDALLVSSHETEVQFMNRADQAVRHVELTADSMEKILVGACSDAAFPELDDFNWGSTCVKDNQTGFSTCCLNNDCGFDTNWPTVSHVCNHSTGTIKQRNAWDYDGGAWNVTAWGELGVEQQSGWAIGYTSTQKRYAADGESTNGRKFHLRSGVRYEDQ